LTTPGFITNGRTAGTLTLTTSKGSLTLVVKGPSQPGFSSLPPTLTYHISQGTGAYSGDTGSGTIGVNLVMPTAGANDLPSPGAVSGSLTLVFHSAKS